MYLVHFFRRDISGNNLSTVTFDIRKVWISEQIFWKSVPLLVDECTVKTFQSRPKLSQTFHKTSFVNLGGRLRPSFKLEVVFRQRAYCTHHQKKQQNYRLGWYVGECGFLHGASVFYSVVLNNVQQRTLSCKRVPCFFYMTREFHHTAIVKQMKHKKFEQNDPDKKNLVTVVRVQN